MSELQRFTGDVVQCRVVEEDAHAAREHDPVLDGEQRSEVPLDVHVGPEEDVLADRRPEGAKLDDAGIISHGRHATPRTRSRSPPRARGKCTRCGAPDRHPR